MASFSGSEFCGGNNCVYTLHEIMGIVRGVFNDDAECLPLPQSYISTPLMSSVALPRGGVVFESHGAGGKGFFAASSNEFPKFSISI